MENSSDVRLETLFTQKDTDRVDSPHLPIHLLLPDSPEEQPDKSQLTIKVNFHQEQAIDSKSIRETLEYVCKDQGLTSLPPSFGITHLHLKSLDLRSNVFREIPSEVFTLYNLRILRMDDNMINSIPPGIGQLTCLQVLTLSHNSIYYVHSSLEKLKGLNALILSENALEDWHGYFCVALNNLRILHLHGNPKIKGIPLTFSEMERLQEFSHDWYGYLPGGERILRGPHGLLKIAETRRLCKILAKQKKPSAYCTFSVFLQYFVPSMEILQAEVYPLHLAASKGHNKVILEELIELMDVNALDDKGQTALAIAVRGRNKEGAKMLAKDERVDVNCAIFGENTPVLHACLKYGWLEVAAAIISHPSFLPTVQDPSGNTPLHILFENFTMDPKRCVAICEKLLKVVGCDPNARNKNRLTPLHCAARKNQRECIKFCLKHNKENTGSYQFNFNAVGGNHSFSVLHYLVIYSTIETINDVLSENVNVFVMDKYGRTPRDLLKNSIVGKLLLKYEQRQKYGLMELNQEKSIEREQTKKMHSFENAKAQVAKKEAQPVFIKMMKSKANELSRNTLPVMDPLDCMEKHGYRFTEFDDSEEIANWDTPRIAARVLRKPSGLLEVDNSENEIEVEEQFLMTHKEDTVTQINLSKEDRMLIQNKYSELYNMIMGEECTKAFKYRLLYYIFNQYDEDAREITQLLCENMDPGDPLFEDTKYINSILNSMRECNVKYKRKDLGIWKVRVGSNGKRINTEIAEERTPTKVKRPFRSALKLCSPDNVLKSSKGKMDKRYTTEIFL